jgi:hypothetical protein
MIISKVAEGTKPKTLLGWNKTTSYVSIMITFGKYYFNLRLRWYPKPKCLIMTKSIDTGVPIEWFPSENVAIVKNWELKLDKPQ